VAVRPAAHRQSETLTKGDGQEDWVRFAV